MRDLQDQFKKSDEGGKGAQATLISKFQKDIASTKRQARIPASHHVQTAELVQAEEEKKELSARLFKEREEKEKMAERISEL